MLSNYIFDSHPSTKGGCELVTIPPGEITKPRQYSHHELIAFVHSGSGKAWLKADDQEYMLSIINGLSVAIPQNSTIQINNNSDKELALIFFNMPNREQLAYTESEEQCQDWYASGYMHLPETSIKHLPEMPDYTAPDSSECRLLAAGTLGDLANFTLKPNTTSTAVEHSIVEEIWFFNSGNGEMWLKQGDREAILDLYPGAIITIPARVRFQFRNTGKNNLEFTIVTMPRWPGNHVITFKEGPWEPTVRTPVNANPLHEVLVKKRNDQIQQVSSTLFYNTEQTKAQNDMEAKAALIK